MIKIWVNLCRSLCGPEWTPAALYTSDMHDVRIALENKKAINDELDRLVPEDLYTRRTNDQNEEQGSNPFAFTGPGGFSPARRQGTPSTPTAEVLNRLTMMPNPPPQSTLRRSSRLANQRGAANSTARPLFPDDSPDPGIPLAQPPVENEDPELTKYRELLSLFQEALQHQDYNPAVLGDGKDGINDSVIVNLYTEYINEAQKAIPKFKNQVYISNLNFLIAKSHFQIGVFYKAKQKNLEMINSFKSTIQARIDAGITEAWKDKIAVMAYARIGEYLLDIKESDDSQYGSFSAQPSTLMQVQPGWWLGDTKNARVKIKEFVWDGEGKDAFLKCSSLFPSGKYTLYDSKQKKTKLKGKYTPPLGYVVPEGMPRVGTAGFEEIPEKGDTWTRKDAQRLQKLVAMRERQLKSIDASLGVYKHIANNYLGVFSRNFEKTNRKGQPMSTKVIAEYLQRRHMKLDALDPNFGREIGYKELPDDRKRKAYAKKCETLKRRLNKCNTKMERKRQPADRKTNPNRRRRSPSRSGPSQSGSSSSQQRRRSTSSGSSSRSQRRRPTRSGSSPRQSANASATSQVRRSARLQEHKDDVSALLGGNFVPSEKRQMASTPPQGSASGPGFFDWFDKLPPEQQEAVRNGTLFSDNDAGRV